MQVKRGLAVAVALGVAAGGCGGSKPLTKAEFVKRADAVCEKMQTEGVAMVKAAVAAQKAQHLSEAQARAQFAPRVAALRTRQLKQLEALKPPAELQAAFTQWAQADLVAIKHSLQSTNISLAEHVKLEKLERQLGIGRNCL